MVGGINYTQTVNSAEELILGSCCTNAIEFEVQNNKNLLNSLSGREAVWKTGALLETKILNDTAIVINQNLICVNGNYIYSANTESNILNIWVMMDNRIDKLDMQIEQPNLAIDAILIVGDKLYLCHSESPYLTIYNVMDGIMTKQPYINITDFQIQQILYYSKYNICFSMQGDIQKEYITKLFNLKPIELIEKTFEFSQMGIFIIEQPTKVNDTRLKVKCYDRMTKFDILIDDWLDTLNYPIRLKDLLTGLCNYVGVRLDTQEFLNSDFEVKKNFKGSGVTGRQFLQWIVEPTANFATLNTKGNLELRWYKQKEIKIKNENYYNIEVSEYTVQKYTKLQIQAVENDIGVIVGAGTNAYVIQANPLLYAESDAELRPFATKIFNSIKELTYRPMSCSIIANIHINSGDIVQFETANGDMFSSIIMNKTSKGTIDTLESTGAEIRSVNTNVHQVITQLRGKSNVLEITIDGLKNTITDVNEGLQTQITVNANGLTSLAKKTETISGNLDDFKILANSEFESLQNQVDGQIMTWFYDYVPTLLNYPATEWNTENLKIVHAGDLFYNSNNGLGYRFSKVDNKWTWEVLKDTEVAKALGNAQKAQDTADGKRRVFPKQPIPPYDIGDLWVNANYGEMYKDEILRCRLDKTVGVFDINDWEKASNYTDDSTIKDFIEGEYSETVTSLKSQIDKKAETWYQPSDPSSEWTTTSIRQEHVGDLWYNTITKKTFIYSNKFDWQLQDIPQEIFDVIDGKNSLYVQKPDKYNIADLWIVENDTVIPNFKTGDLLTSSQNSDSYTASHWNKKVRYTDDTAVNGVVDRVVKTETAITQQADSIKLTAESVTTMSKDVTAVTNAVADLTVTADNIITEVNKKVNDKDFGTKIVQNAKSVQISWNTISEYIQFLDAQLQIKDGNKKLLMALSKVGLHFWKDDIDIGYIGDTAYSGNSQVKGLQFALMTQGFMGFTQKKQGKDEYELKFTYFDDFRAMQQGLHFFDVAFLNNNALNLGTDQNMSITMFSDGSGGFRSNGKDFVIVTDGYDAIRVENSGRGVDDKIHFKKNLDMNGYDIVNACIIQSYDYPSSASYSSRTRMESKQVIFKPVLSVEEVQTYISEVQISNGKQFVDLPDYFKYRETDYQVFLSKQGQGDVWYCEKTNLGFTICAENDIKVSYEIKMPVIVPTAFSRARTETQRQKLTPATPKKYTVLDTTKPKEG